MWKTYFPSSAESRVILGLFSREANECNFRGRAQTNRKAVPEPRTGMHIHQRTHSWSPWQYCTGYFPYVYSRNLSSCQGQCRIFRWQVPAVHRHKTEFQVSLREALRPPGRRFRILCQLRSFFISLCLYLTLFKLAGIQICIESVSFLYNKIMRGSTG